MADLSKIKLNGTEYDLKDGLIRNFLQNGLWATADSNLIEYVEFDTGAHYQQCFMIYYDGTPYFAVGEKHFKSLDGKNIQFHSGMSVWVSDDSNPIDDSKITGGYKLKIPTLEPVSNVEAMLTSFGLNANANLTSATVPATLDSAVAL